MADRQQSIAVIGLGRFGSAVAENLAALGHEVLAIDNDMDRVQAYADRLDHVVQADATDEAALHELGIDRMDHAVIAIGGDLEASVLTATALADLKIPDIWAKALTDKHARLLERVGVHHVIFPERAMGERVAHLISDQLLDYIEFEDQFSIAKVATPRGSAGQTLAQFALRSRYGITVVGIKHPGQDFIAATPDTVLEEGALLIVAGETAAIQKFAGEA